jgi:hypothetical protein
VHNVVVPDVNTTDPVAPAGRPPGVNVTAVPKGAVLGDDETEKAVGASPTEKLVVAEEPWWSGSPE